MIVVKLAGGLGNQIFQYAFGRQLSITNNTTLYLDPSDLQTYSTKRKYRLHRYTISAYLMDKTENRLLDQQTRRGVMKTMLGKMAEHIKLKNLRIIKESSVNFDPEKLQHSRNCLVYGYWQNEKYFINIRDLLLKELCISDSISNHNEVFLKNILSSDAISMHIRRGDYISSKENQSVYYTCDQDYYSNALSIIKEKYLSPHLFIFSDDINWVKSNLEFSIPRTYISGDSEDQDIEELYLMSKCKSHIIANSSFSWWGAWLCSFPQQYVVAPKNWFVDKRMNTEMKLPEKWRRI